MNFACLSKRVQMYKLFLIQQAKKIFFLIFFYFPNNLPQITQWTPVKTDRKDKTTNSTQPNVFENKFTFFTII